jgi:adenosylcobinamide kinase/adenosylcobinamide-phosphate guanylyltransferase
MKILYFGGQKSGKSALAEAKTLMLSQNKKPYYIATYDNSYGDNSMQEKIDLHKLQREDKFISIEQSHNLLDVIDENQTYLIDCISMWILNNIEKPNEYFIDHLEKISKIKSNIVFVLNDVNSGIIPIDKQSRRFVDLTGIVGSKLTSFCNEVYEVKFSLGVRLK